MLAEWKYDNYNLMTTNYEAVHSLLLKEEGDKSKAAVIYYYLRDILIS